MELIERRCADESAKWGETVTTDLPLGGYLVLDHRSMGEAVVKERDAMLKGLKVRLLKLIKIRTNICLSGPILNTIESLVRNPSSTIEKMPVLSSLSCVPLMRRAKLWTAHALFLSMGK